MKVLFLAPQPFFEERGTPIAVRMALQVLAERRSESVDLLTYHLGANVQLPGLKVHRIPSLPFIRAVGPGISVRKLLCDIFFTVKAWTMVAGGYVRGERYDLVHAVEESVFIAWVIKLFTGTPYIYDMDSSLAMQVTEKWSVLRPIQGLLTWAERLAVRSATAVVPVCDALAVLAEAHGSKDTHILRDVSLLDLDGTPPPVQNLRQEFNIPNNGTLLLYIGNLEPYQGIDLLLESFALSAKGESTARLVIIGGTEVHIEKYKMKARELQIENRVHFAGPRPVASLNGYLTQADLLLSPRVRGNNTPMKIYSYLHVGRAIVATNLPTHTQVLSSDVAFLGDPSPEAFSSVLSKAVVNPELRATIGERARALAEEHYTFAIFCKRLNELYDRISERLITGSPTSARDNS